MSSSTNVEVSIRADLGILWRWCHLSDPVIRELIYIRGELLSKGMRGLGMPYGTRWRNWRAVCHLLYVFVLNHWLLPSSLCTQGWELKHLKIINPCNLSNPWFFSATYCWRRILRNTHLIFAGMCHFPFSRCYQILIICQICNIYRALRRLWSKNLIAQWPRCYCQSENGRMYVNFMICSRHSALTKLKIGFIRWISCLNSNNRLNHSVHLSIGWGPSIPWSNTILMLKNLVSTPGRYIVESVNSFYVSYRTLASDVDVPLVSNPSQTPGTSMVLCLFCSPLAQSFV